MARHYLKLHPWVLLNASDHTHMTSLDWYKIGDIFADFERTRNESNIEATLLNKTSTLEDIFSQLNCGSVI
jgi:hypothetical protein